MPDLPVAQNGNADKSATDRGRLVSIIIVNYNGSEWLRACLESLAMAKHQQREVIVVDNASSDDSLRVLENYSWVRVVRSAKNLGFAGGNNLGLLHCRGEYVLLLNNDTVVPQDFLEPLCEYLNQHAVVGVVQGKMVLPRWGGTLDVCGSFLTAFGLPYHYGYYKPDGPKYNRNYPVFSGKGACLMFRREIISQVGGFLFDEDFFCYYEESDFCHRVWLAGYEVHFISGPPVQHFMGSTSGGPHELFVLRHYLRNMAFSLMGNLSPASRLRILPFFFAVVVASMATSALRARWAQAGAHLEALLYPVRKWRSVRERRRLIQSIRKWSDRKIFAKAMKNPRLGYFVKTFTGKLGQYEDDPL